MREPPDTILQVLARVRNRTWLRDALHAISAACLGATLVIALGRLLSVSQYRATAAAFSVAGIVGALWLVMTSEGRTSSAAAVLVEGVDRSLRNLLVTAEEIIRDPGHTAPYMRSRVLDEAAARVARTNASAVVPLTRAVALCSCAVVVLGILSPLSRSPQRLESEGSATKTDGANKPAAAGDLVVDLVPPLYSGLSSRRLKNPSSIEAFAGSRATLSIAAATKANPRIRVNGTEIVARRTTAGTTADWVMSDSGYLAIDGEDVGKRWLVPISVVADHVPDVRVTSPGHDLRVNDRSKPIRIDASARDDLGLSAIEIRYTKISGTGEQFEFLEGTLPSAVERSSGTAWQAHGALSLTALKMEPGDALVYRAVARDKRPGDAGLGTSETYFVEVAGPGEIALTNLDMPPDRERYALSQQMIVLKIERLLARQPSLPRPAVEETSAAIGAEQRAVRANFVFLLGGSVEDEETEAQESTEILEGRFENRARQEILTATRLMTRVEQALSAAATSAALPPAREAVLALQRAFGHSRYLLRALPNRGRVDPSRRLSGDRTSAEDWHRALTPVNPDPVAAASRDALLDLLRVAALIKDDQGALRIKPEAAVPDRLAALAEHVLQIDPRSADIQTASRELLAARDALLSGRAADLYRAFQRVAPALLSRASQNRTDIGESSPLLDRLTGALAVDGVRR